MNVSPEAERLFAEAMEKEPGARERFVADACNTNRELYDEVMSLLSAAGESADYFERLSSKVGIPAFADEGASLPQDKVVGHWRVERVIGRGGMGAVYLAQRADEQFEQEAALKVLPFGLDTEAARARFFMERQILADLDHANIARLIDGGVTEEGSPYFVMEYVDGVPIDVYCDEQSLDIEGRIRLFLGVLAAVSHAHARLVVHRDIKPSNVLVDRSGQPRLLDFGVAKLLQPAGNAPNAGMTRELGVALTPEYAAPEQLLGQTITTATDVYALGLMLYELLSGHPPRDVGSVDSFAALVEVASRNPPKASTVASHGQRRRTTDRSLERKLRGDLDNILRKALSPEPAERYGTASDFSTDLRRYLDGETVSAMPPTLSYRAQKFIGRHRGGVLTTLLTAIALIVSLVLATSQMIEARQQRDAAIYQQQRVLASNEFLMLLMGEIGPKGEALALGELLDRGVGMLEQSFGDDYRFLGRMYVDLATGYFSLGKTERMLDLLARAETFARANNDPDLLAAALCKSAVLEIRSAPEQSIARIEEANTVMARVDVPSMDSYIYCARANADMIELQGDRQAAIDSLRFALEAIDSSPLASVHAQLLTMNQLGNLHHKNGDREESMAVNARILALMEQTGRSGTAGYMINSLNRSVFLQSMGEVKNAFEIRKGLLARIEALKDSGKAPISILSFYAASLMRLDRYDEALEVALDALDDAKAAGNVSWAAQDELQVGRILIYLGRFDEAGDYLAAAEASFTRAASSNDRLLQAVRFARTRLSLGRDDGATARMMIDEELARLDYPATLGSPGTATALRIAAEVALATRDAEAAEQFATDSYDLAIKAARDWRLSANVGNALLLRAKARLMLGQGSLAAADLQKAGEALSNGLGDDNPRTIEAGTLLETL